jgi:Family of unknown function (DUF6636)
VASPVRALARTIGLTAALWGSALVAAGSAQAFVMFESPSGNIGCIIGKLDGVRCDIRAKSWTPPPKPSWCDVDWGGGVQVGRRKRASFVCAGDTVLGGDRTLAYGTSIRRGRFECFSRRTGMRCVNHRSHHGFRLSRQHAGLF